MGIISNELFLPTDWRTTVELTRASIIGSVGLSWCRAITGSDRAARSSKPSRPGSSIRPQLIHAAGPSPHATCMHTYATERSRYVQIICRLNWVKLHACSFFTSGWMDVRAINHVVAFYYACVRQAVHEKKERMCVDPWACFSLYLTWCINTCMCTHQAVTFLPSFPNCVCVYI
jgi:hypothetical protein